MALITRFLSGMVPLTAVLLMLAPPAYAQTTSCILSWRKSRPVLGTNKPGLACSLTDGSANVFGIRDRGNFSRLKYKDFLRFVRQPRSPLRRKTERQLKTRFAQLKALCAEQSSESYADATFRAGESCDAVTATATPESSPTAINSPTAVATTTPAPTATPTPTPTPSPDSSIALSTASYDFGTVGPDENRYGYIVVNALQGSPYILGIDLVDTDGISLLSTAEVTERGGVPCEGTLGRFCVVQAHLDASSPGTKSATIRIRYTDDGTPFPQPQGSSSVSLSALVQSTPVSQTNAFRTVGLRALAQAAGVTAPEYLRREFEKIAPSSYDTNDPFLFDTYSEAGASDWRNSWTNSIFDLSGLAWDTHQDGTAITRCHVIYARHYQRGSGTIVFHRKDGTRWTSNIAPGASQSFPNGGDYAYDVTVARINPCLPADWTIYPLLDPNDAFTQTELQNAPYLNTHYNTSNGIRRISVTRVDSISQPDLQVSGALSLVMPSYMQVSAQVGDSGNPSFLYVNGELVVISTFTFAGYGGTGPYFGSSTHQQLFNNAIAALP